MAKRPYDPYARIAPLYDALTTLPLAGIRKRITLLCRELGISRVLDVGCGTGAQLALFAAAGFEAAGVESSECMLRKAASRLRGEVPLFHSGERPLFPEGSFDAILFSLVLHEAAVPAEQLLTEALRVAPKVVVLEWRMPERNLELPLQLLVHIIERLAGREHYRAFRRYAAGGWLHGLAQRVGTRVAHEERAALGTLVLAVLERG